MDMAGNVHVEEIEKGTRLVAHRLVDFREMWKEAAVEDADNHGRNDPTKISRKGWFTVGMPGQS